MIQQGSLVRISGARLGGVVAFYSNSGDPVVDVVWQTSREQSFFVDRLEEV